MLKPPEEVRRMPSRSKQWAKLRASFSPRARSSALPLQDFSGPQFPCLHIAFPEQLFLVFRLADLAAAGIRQCLQHSTAVTALVHHQIKGIVNAGRSFPVPGAHSLACVSSGVVASVVVPT